MRELRKGIQLKFQNRDVVVDGNIRETGDVGRNSGKTAGRAPHVAWCPVHSWRPLKIRRTECRSRPVVLITTSGLQASGRWNNVGKGSRQNGSVTSGKGLALRARLGCPSSEPIDSANVVRVDRLVPAGGRIGNGSFRIFPRASNSQLRTGTDKGNPTV
ncbi:LOW QUALITY PROTEIN: hypothetical protein YC2023_066371 [Brassica napus]